MTGLVARKRIEIIADRPLLAEIIAMARDCGIAGHTVIRLESGEGHSGRWREDQVTAAESKAMLLIITAEERAVALIDAVAPLLDSHGLMLTAADAGVVRGGHFG